MRSPGSIQLVYRRQRHHLLLDVDIRIGERVVDRADQRAVGQFLAQHIAHFRRFLLSDPIPVPTETADFPRGPHPHGNMPRTFIRVCPEWPARYGRALTLLLHDCLPVLDGLRIFYVHRRSRHRARNGPQSVLRHDLLDRCLRSHTLPYIATRLRGCRYNAFTGGSSNDGRILHIHVDERDGWTQPRLEASPLCYW